MTLSFSDVLLRDSSEMSSTLECISNRVGGSYISNTSGLGFRSKSLLEEAGLQDGVVDIKMEAADGYSESIPLSEALQDDTMLVYLIDGQPLTEKHGFPVAPHRSEHLRDEERQVDHQYPSGRRGFQGYWQERQWSDVATVVTMSRIDIPSRGARRIWVTLSSLAASRSPEIAAYPW